MAHHKTTAKANIITVKDANNTYTASWDGEKASCTAGEAGANLSDLLCVRPKRVQRKRTKGWKMPENTVYVGRGSKYGNPCIVDNDSQRSSAVAWFESHIAPRMDLSSLRGKNLACWCGLEKECHADVLLRMANT